MLIKALHNQAMTERKQSSKTATATKNNWTVKAQFYIKDQYGNLSFSCSSADEHFELLTTLQKKISDLYPESYNPVWATEDFVKLSVKPYLSNGDLVKVLKGHQYEIVFNIIQHTSQTGKQSISIKLIKQAKLIKKVSSDDHVISL